MSSPSHILYQNSLRTIFLIDIPKSIEDAQYGSESSNQWPRRRTYSTAPVRHLHPPTEPKKEAARARVLERIPESEKVYHARILPFAQRSLQELRNALSSYGGDPAPEWCLPRMLVKTTEEKPDPPATRRSTSSDEDHGPPRKTVKQGISAEPFKFSPAQNQKAPVILSSSSVNEFSSQLDFVDVEVRNTSSDSAQIQKGLPNSATKHDYKRFTVPPRSSFVLEKLAMPWDLEEHNTRPIAGLSPVKKFNVILFDPPWANRSVRRSRNYQTYQGTDAFVALMRDIVLVHLSEDRLCDDPQRQALVAIWTTNKANSRQAAWDLFGTAGLTLCEEWIWVKTTTNGQPILPLDGLWRKPYEVLLLAKRSKPNDLRNPSSPAPLRRLLAAVPEIHSRKPNLKTVFDEIFFAQSSSSSTSAAAASQTRLQREEYTGLEVFARSLTAGWCAVGDEVLKFNSDKWWVETGG